MDNFFFFLMFCFLTTPFIAYWAYRRDQSVLEYVFLSILFSPIVPALILLIGEFSNRTDSETQENLAN